MYQLCFEQKNENSKNISTENCHFYSCEISLYIAWECLRNGIMSSVSFLMSQQRQANPIFPGLFA